MRKLITTDGDTQTSSDDGAKPAAVAAPTPVPTAAPAAPVASAEKAVEAKAG